VDKGLDASRFNYVDLLCKTMVDAAKTGPVKAECDGYVFVVDKSAKMMETLQAWKEQAEKPFWEKFSPDRLAHILKLNADITDLGDTASSYSEAAFTETLVTKHPEYTDKISMLQLLNAFKKSTRENIDAISDALIQNAKRFVNGEETFPPTLENMVELDKNKGMLSLVLASDVNSHELKKRIQETELTMLKNLQPDYLSCLPDSTIVASIEIAKKHKDSGNFEEMFSQEIINRVSRGKIFNPNVK
jgi:hypothetical protein